MVEQRTENPCVPGSIPGGTTTKAEKTQPGRLGFFALVSLSERQRSSTSWDITRSCDFGIKLF